MPRRLGHAAGRLRAGGGLPDRRPGAGQPPSRRGSSAAKACSFILNLLALPALYVFARRRYGCRVAIWTMAVLAVLPVHAIYAGFVLRESLVALTSILAVWTLTEVWHAEPGRRAIWAWAVAAGLCGGLAVLVAHDRAGDCWRPRGCSPWSRTAEAGSARSCSGASIAAGRASPGPGRPVGSMERPFYSYTSYFEYNFSWTVHHYEKGNTLAVPVLHAGKPARDRAGQDQVAVLIIVVYSTMIVGLPIVAGLLPAPGRREAGRDARPTCWSRRSAWCSCWRRSRASPT